MQADKLRDRRVALAGEFQRVSDTHARRSLKALGAKIVDEVTAETWLLFVGARPGQPLAEATDEGVRVLGESALVELIGSDVPARAPIVLQPNLAPAELTAAIRAVSWDEATPDDLAALRATLYAHERLNDGLTEAHTEAWRVVSAAHEVTVRTNTPHNNELVAWTLSPDGRFLATGSWTGELYCSGRIAIWETQSGRCVHVIHRVRGGVGWPRHKGCVQWSPCGQYLGLTLDTNGLTCAAFGADTPDDAEYPAEGWSSPPGWCWAPEGHRIFASCWYMHNQTDPGYITGVLHGSPTMTWTPDEQPESERWQTQPMTYMRWNARDHMLVGWDGYRQPGEAHALDLNTMRRAWRRKMPRACALSDDGTCIALYTPDSGLALMHTGTGDIGDPIESPKVQGLRFSPNGERLASVVRGAVHVYQTTPSLTLEVTLQTTLTYAPRAGEDLQPLAFSHDNSTLALLAQHGGTARVELWALDAPDSPSATFAADGCKGVFFGNEVVIAASQHELLFARTDGTRIAHHDLYPTGPDNPLYANPIHDNLHLDDDDAERLMPFPDPEDRFGWGYAAPTLIVGHNPEPHAQAVLGRRVAWPLRWTDLPHLLNLSDAEARFPNALPDDLYEAHQEALIHTARRPNPQPPTASESDLVRFLMACLDRAPEHQINRRGAYEAEVAMHCATAQRLDEAATALARIDPLKAPLACAKAATYLASASGANPATQTALEALEHHLADGAWSRWSTRPAILAWIAAAHTESRSEAAQDAWARAKAAHTDPTKALEWATALAVIGDIDGALDAFEGHTDTTRRFNIGALVERIADDADPADKLRFAARLEHHRITDPGVWLYLARGCVDFAEREQGWAMLGRVRPGLRDPAFNRAHLKLAQHIQRDAGARAVMALLTDDFHEALTQGHVARQGHTLGLWAALEYDPVGLRTLCTEAIEAFDLSTRYNTNALTYWCIGMHDAASHAGVHDAWVELMLKLPNPERCWAAALHSLTPSHPQWEAMLEGALAEHEQLHPVLTCALRPHPEAYAALVDRYIKRARRDRFDLEYIIKATVAAGDLESAERARTQLPRAQRKPLTSCMVVAAVDHGYIDTGLALMRELPAGFSAWDATHEAMRALTEQVWPEGLARVYRA